MAAPCFTGTLSSAINASCVTQVAGIEKDAILIPMSKITLKSVTYDQSLPIISALPLTEPAQGFKITVPGDNPFKDYKIDGKMGQFVQMFESAFAFPILENSPATAKQVMELGNDKYVAIVKFKGYDAAKKNKYGIIGMGRGLSFNTGTFQTDTADNHGWRIALKETDATIPVYFLWDTNETTTDALFESLLTL